MCSYVENIWVCNILHTHINMRMAKLYCPGLSFNCKHAGQLQYLHLLLNKLIMTETAHANDVKVCGWKFSSFAKAWPSFSILIRMSCQEAECNITQSEIKYGCAWSVTELIAWKASLSVYFWHSCVTRFSWLYFLIF